MGYYCYNVMIWGQRIEPEDFEHMRYEQSEDIPVEPKTPFDPQTGEPNLPTIRRVTYKDWKKEYHDFAKVIDEEYNEDDHEALYNGGLPYKDIWLVETWKGELFACPDENHILHFHDGEGVESLNLPNLEACKAPLKEALEPIGLWKPDKVKVWRHTYWA